MIYTDSQLKDKIVQMINDFEAQERVAPVGSSQSVWRHC